jgi:hypothetical protein
MTRTSFALALASVGVVFSVVSGPSGAAPTASSSNGSAKVASSHAVHGGYHRRRSGFAMGGIMARLGPLMAMLANSQGGAGGFTSMFGGGGGSGSFNNTNGIMSMMGSMAGSGGTSGFGSMLGGSGGAQSTPVPQVSDAARQACTPDAMRLCSNYIPDVGRITACMKAKSSQLSAPCRAAMASEGATLSRAASQGVAAPVRGPDYASYGGVGSGANFTGVQNFGGFQAGGIDIGQMIGMARSFGFGSRNGW